MHFSDFNINIKLRLLCGFFTRIFNMAVIPYMAVYFAQYYSPLISGAIVSIAMVLTIVSNLYGGYLADAFDKKKRF